MAKWLLQLLRRVACFAKPCTSSARPIELQPGTGIEPQGLTPQQVQALKQSWIDLCQGRPWTRLVVSPETTTEPPSQQVQEPGAQAKKQASQTGEKGSL